jgi:class 3 adenylate cyclase
MPRLKLLAAIAIEEEATFSLILQKFTELPQQLQARGLDTLPQLMLVSDLLRCLRDQFTHPQVSIFLEEGIALRRGTCRLLFHLASATVTEEENQQGEQMIIPNYLQDLLALHQVDPSPYRLFQDNSVVVCLPLHKSLDQDQIRSLTVNLNVPTRERLMADLELEKQKARGVLDKIFPSSVVRQLENGASAIYDYYPSTTILFSDMVGFTTMSKDMDARELVTFIDDVFGRIDRLCIKHGVEKIKTIGDAYMAAAGVPISCEDHAARIAHLAMDILELYQELSARETSGALNARIGIHSGPVVGGVIGLNKFTFDLWGDTVNVASRMESTGIPGEIQLSACTRELLPANFIAHIRGHVAMKGHSSIETFLLRGR